MPKQATTQRSKLSEDINMMQREDNVGDEHASDGKSGANISQLDSFFKSKNWAEYAVGTHDTGEQIRMR